MRDRSRRTQNTHGHKMKQSGALPTVIAQPGGTEGLSRCGLIIPMIIQTARQVPSGSDGIEGL